MFSVGFKGNYFINHPKTACLSSTAILERRQRGEKKCGPRQRGRKFDHCAAWREYGDCFCSLFSSFYIQHLRLKKFTDSLDLSLNCLALLLQELVIICDSFECSCDVRYVGALGDLHDSIFWFHFLPSSVLLLLVFFFSILSSPFSPLFSCIRCPRRHPHSAFLFLGIDGRKGSLPDISMPFDQSSAQS